LVIGICRKLGCCHGQLSLLAADLDSDGTWNGYDRHLNYEFSDGAEIAAELLAEEAAFGGCFSDRLETR
jgi:hypothetical protein